MGTFWIWWILWVGTAVIALQKLRVILNWLNNLPSGSQAIVISSLFLILPIIGAVTWTGIEKAKEEFWPDSPFKITPYLLWISESRPNQILASAIWVGYKEKSGYVITPSHFDICFRLVNSSDKPVIIDTLALQLETMDGEWVSLRRMPFAGADTYIVFDKLDTAGLIEISALDQSLRGVALKPGEPVEGWMLYQYPALYVGKFKFSRYRFVIVDSNGLNSVVTISPPINELPPDMRQLNNFQGARFKILQKNVDQSQSTIRLIAP